MKDAADSDFVSRMHIIDDIPAMEPGSCRRANFVSRPANVRMSFQQGKGFFEAGEKSIGSFWSPTIRSIIGDVQQIHPRLRRQRKPNQPIFARQRGFVLPQ